MGGVPEKIKPRACKPETHAHDSGLAWVGECMGQHEIEVFFEGLQGLQAKAVDRLKTWIICCRSDLPIALTACHSASATHDR